MSSEEQEGKEITTPTAKDARDLSTIREWLWEAVELMKVGDYAEAELLIDEMYDAVTEAVS